MDIIAGAVPAFLASLVEFVEAFTIVLAVGVSRSWRASLAGAGVATAALVVLVVGFGPTLLDRIDERVLLLVIGVLLLLFGGRWLRKAILRAAGYIPLHDEAAAFAAEVDALSEASRARRFDGARFDWAGFAVSGKGVFLEGVEVAFIVLTLGATGAGYGVPAAGAGAALLLVVVVGAALRRPLTRVPENTLKFAVGAMLVTFGVYWTAEGLGVHWTGGAAALGYLLATTLALALFAVRLRRTATQPAVLS
ncbi:MAG: TMEM165/GDT1 family protein [Actinomycetota bacterium]|nr:TMEM165/GDT1 family protein [Actinomycetota bacterium]